MESRTVNQQLAGEFAGRYVRYPKDRNVLQLFESWVDAAPEATAVTFGTDTLSYRGLDRRAAALAARLRELGVTRGDFVPLAVEGGLELPVAMVAAMKLGAPFVPVDDQAPDDRLRGMLATLDAKLVVCSPGLADRPFGVPVLPVDALALPEDVPAPDTDPSDLDDPVYGFYTSGSTGLPKCAVNIHRGLLNRFQHMTAHLSDRSDEVVLQNSRHQFDSSLWQLLWPLTTGSQVVIPKRSGILDLTATIDVVHRHGVTMTDFVPSVFATLVELLTSEPGQAARLRSLRTVLIGGEEMTAAAVHTFRALVPGVTVVNTYGPTEASIGSVFHEVSDADRDPMPIGRPIDNTYAVVLDEELRPVLPGEIGEICVGGECLGLGYLKDPERTDAAFITNPFPEIPGTRLYRTGDLGFHRPDGVLQFSGRRDHQVKIGGVRIELTEVEAAVLTHPLVRDAKALVDENQGNPLLTAFVVLREAGAGDDGLREHVGRVLPPALVPRRFVVLDQMPLTPNGKTDRRQLAALLAPARRAAVPEAGGDVADETGESVRAAWLRLLPRSEVRPDDDFFACGGDSLSAQRLAVRLTEITGTKWSARDVFLHPTLGAQLARIAGRGMPTAAPAPALEAASFIERAGTDTELPAGISADLERLGAAAKAAAEAKPSAAPPRHILLTGATGFIGAQLLHDLLASTPATVHCLVRAEDAPSARWRLTAQLAGYRLWDEAWPERIVAVPGDLGEPRLGLGAAEFDRLAEVTDTVVHCGATVNFTRDYAAHRDVNVGGTLELIRLAARSRLKPFHFLSTLSVLPQGQPLEEPVAADLPPADGYSRSKWVGELLLQRAAERGLPLAVHRFGDVMPHSRHGVPSRWGLPDLLVRACARTGLRFRSPAVMDYLPVDYAGALVTAAVLRHAYGYFHPMRPQPTRLDELLLAFRHELGLTEVSYETFWSAVETSAAVDGDRDAAALLALLPEPSGDAAHDGKRIAALLRYEPLPATRRNADRLAAAAGLGRPPVGPETFARYAGHYRTTRQDGAALPVIELVG